MTQFCLENNYLFVLLDLLMGSDSPYAPKDKKRQDFPYQVALPLVQTVLRLIQRKKNRVGSIPFKLQNLDEDKYYELTQKQTTILMSINFYKRMMKFKYDNGLLASVVYFMCMNDVKISESISQLFLLGLNNLSQVQDSFSLLNVLIYLQLQNIKAFLFIKDPIQSERLKWIFGIPQFLNFRQSYCLRYSSQSSNIDYVSSRYFIAEQKFKPALQVLHEKKGYFTDFQVRGIITLLEIITNFQEAFLYVFSLPAPSYLYESYISWIQDYTYKLQNQDHYGFSMDKKGLVNILKNLLQQVDKKKKFFNIQLPALKKIIGKNKKLELEEHSENQVYLLKKWVHQTYVLENLPVQHKRQNLSMTDQIFDMKSLKSYAKYFIDSCQIKFNDPQPQLQAQMTIITLQIQTKFPLKLKFEIPYFKHQIYVQNGKSSISYPYTDFPLETYLEIQILKQPTMIAEVKANTDQNKTNKLNMDEQRSSMTAATSPWVPVDVPGYSAQSNFQMPCPAVRNVRFVRVHFSELG